jgi:hypothetical protein
MIAEKDPFALEQRFEEAAAVEPEQRAGHVAAILGGDAAVVGVERGRFGAEDGHVAVEEQTGFFVDVVARDRAVARGQFDQFGDAVGVDALARQPARDVVARQQRRAGFVVASAGVVDRVVVQHRQRDFARLAPARAGGDVGVVAQHFGDMADVVVSARRGGVGGFERGALFRRQGQRQRG